jgi:glycosyltransferase involved in cell wall biosynthesis
MAKIQIVLLTDTLRYGGSERLLVDIAKGLDRDVFDVKVCATTAGGELLEGELAQAGIEYRILHKPLGPNLRVIPRVYSLLRRWCPDIVHTFRFTANAYGRVGAALARVPVIVGTEHVLEHKSLGRRMVDLALARVTDRVVVVTDEIAKQVRADHRLPSSRVQLIEEGIDLDRFACIERDPSAGGEASDSRPFKVGIVARLAPQKGHTVFLEAVRLARQMRPAVKGILVGDGELRPELERWVADRRMQETFEFWGFREDLPNVFRALDLFAMSSGWEGLPVALLDAAASGLPFVCTDVGGIAEKFQDGVHGRLAPPGDPVRFADAIVWSLDNYPAACAMAKTASAMVHKQHGLRAMIQEHETMYRQLLDAKGLRRGTRANGQN